MALNVYVHLAIHGVPGTEDAAESMLSVLDVVSVDTSSDEPAITTTTSQFALTKGQAASRQRRQVQARLRAAGYPTARVYVEACERWGITDDLWLLWRALRWHLAPKRR